MNIDALLKKRLQNNELRTLDDTVYPIDFVSNDYLGLAYNDNKNQTLLKVKELLATHNISNLASTGSRLLSGNFSLQNEFEKELANYYEFEDVLLFNSAYTANLSLLATVSEKKDYILFDEQCHASIKQACRLCNASSYKFKHNDINDLAKKIQVANNKKASSIFIVVESFYSMSGDIALLEEICALKKNNIFIIVDEAHSNGVIGMQGQGLVHSLKLNKSIFAVVYGFGKAWAANGAVIAGSSKLKQVLTNYALPFIYTTAMSPLMVALLMIRFQQLQVAGGRENLIINMTYFSKLMQRDDLSSKELFVPIKTVELESIESCKQIATFLQKNNFWIKPIVYPTVKRGEEKLRLTLHSYNKKKEIEDLVFLLKRIASTKRGIIK